MAEPIVLRGYAAPFLQAAWLQISDDHGEHERIACNAFDRMLRAGKNVALQFDTHDPAPAVAATNDGSLYLFVDEYGLGFEARIESTLKNWGVCSAVIRTHRYASINMVQMRRSVRRPSGMGGQAVQQVDEAEIDHIVIADISAVYKGTATWAADAGLEAAPPRIQEMAWRWENGSRRQFSSRTRPSADAPHTIAATSKSRIDMVMAEHNRFMARHPSIGAAQKYFAAMRGRELPR